MAQHWRFIINFPLPVAPNKPRVFTMNKLPLTIIEKRSLFIAKK